MNSVIIVEGQTDAALIGRLLKPWKSPPKIVVAHGVSSAISLARSHLALGSPRVVLVLDADAEPADPERERSVRALLTDAGDAERWRLVFQVPNLKATQSPAQPESPKWRAAKHPIVTTPCASRLKPP